MTEWWCVRYGDALAWVEAPSEAAAVRRSLDLHPLGDWTDDARDIVGLRCAYGIRRPGAPIRLIPSLIDA